MLTDEQLLRHDAFSDVTTVTIWISQIKALGALPGPSRKHIGKPSQEDNGLADNL